jgi:hypothetical protein
MEIDAVDVYFFCAVYGGIRPEKAGQGGPNKLGKGVPAGQARKDNAGAHKKERAHARGLRQMRG